ncbi:hypothetical protein E2562_002331 [Oryza meyeriana var. granulata]|uniref:Uncharacterized protein n=1 Tax=Oryza meyeriana var. granulata TaxID=110450 RepID=A0A6G1BIQ3_9ORYZ|nr:hypothetical protein E2562_002331 [Oryza meyeriana var. granulata]
MGVGLPAVRRPNHGGVAYSRFGEAEEAPGRRAGRAAGAPCRQSQSGRQSRRPGQAERRAIGAVDGRPAGRRTGGGRES